MTFTFFTAKSTFLKLEKSYLHKNLLKFNFQLIRIGTVHVHLQTTINVRCALCLQTSISSKHVYKHQFQANMISACLQSFSLKSVPHCETSHSN